MKNKRVGGRDVVLCSAMVDDLWCRMTQYCSRCGPHNTIVVVDGVSRGKVRWLGGGRAKLVVSLEESSKDNNLQLLEFHWYKILLSHIGGK